MYFLLTVLYLLPYISIECSLVLVFWEHVYYFSLFLLLSTTHIFHIPVRDLLSDVQLPVFPDVPQSNTTFRSLCNFCLLYLRALFIFTKQKPEQGKRIVPLTQPKALPQLQAGLANTLSRPELSANLSIMPWAGESTALSQFLSWSITVPGKPCKCLGALYHHFQSHCPLPAHAGCLCHCSKQLNSSHGRD